MFNIKIEPISVDQDFSTPDEAFISRLEQPIMLSPEDRSQMSSALKILCNGEKTRLERSKASDALHTIERALAKNGLAAAKIFSDSLRELFDTLSIKKIDLLREDLREMERLARGKGRVANQPLVSSMQRWTKRLSKEDTKISSEEVERICEVFESASSEIGKTDAGVREEFIDLALQVYRTRLFDNTTVSRCLHRRFDGNDPFLGEPEDYNLLDYLSVRGIPNLKNYSYCVDLADLGESAELLIDSKNCTSAVVRKALLTIFAAKKRIDALNPSTGREFSQLLRKLIKEPGCSDRVREAIENRFGTDEMRRIADSCSELRQSTRDFFNLYCYESFDHRPAHQGFLVVENFSVVTEAIRINSGDASADRFAELAKKNFETRDDLEKMKAENSSVLQEGLGRQNLGTFSAPQIRGGLGVPRQFTVKLVSSLQHQSTEGRPTSKDAPSPSNKIQSHVRSDEAADLEIRQGIKKPRVDFQDSEEELEATEQEWAALSGLGSLGEFQVKGVSTDVEINSFAHESYHSLRPTALSVDKVCSAFLIRNTLQSTGDEG